MVSGSKGFTSTTSLYLRRFLEPTLNRPSSRFRGRSVSYLWSGRGTVTFVFVRVSRVRYEDTKERDTMSLGPKTVDFWEPGHLGIRPTPFRWNHPLRRSFGEVPVTIGLPGVHPPSRFCPRGRTLESKRRSGKQRKGSRNHPTKEFPLCFLFESVRTIEVYRVEDVEKKGSFVGVGLC